MTRCAHLERRGGVPVVVVDVADWLDASTAPGVADVLGRALDGAPAEVVVDLTATEMVDPFALGVLARAEGRARRQGTVVRLTGANARVRRVRDLVGLEQRLPDLEEVPS